MNRLFAVSVLALALVPAVSSALEISNIRPRYGPYGATRTDLDCLAKDVLVITYDISGLTVDPKTSKAKYSTTLELLDANKKVIFSKDTTNEPMLQLGGGKMPGDLFVQIGAKQAPGKYTIRLTVTDRLDKNKGNAAKVFSYPYEVVKDKFGLIGVSAPAVGIPGLPYAAEFALANFTLDKKDQPKGDVSIRVLDEKGNVVDSVKHVLPADLPAGTDLKENNVLPFRHPVYLNRPGRFTLEILAEDKLGGSKVELRYPFNVIDLNSVSK
ncbi:MAG TPA: hypothetical protein VFE62_22870 [Gemmataceae bacterium]|nr:hypothetical protein [Gemmataceae bacterium]